MVKCFIFYRFEQQNVQLKELMADKERAQSQAAKDAIQQKMNETKEKISNLSYKMAVAEAKSRNVGGSAFPRDEFVPLKEIGKSTSNIFKFQFLH